jgi:hypothetical protein
LPDAFLLSLWAQDLRLPPKVIGGRGHAALEAHFDQPILRIFRLQAPSRNLCGQLLNTAGSAAGWFPRVRPIAHAGAGFILPGSDLFFPGFQDFWPVLGEPGHLPRLTLLFHLSSDF